MSAELKRIRHAVFLRANNRCECGCGRWVTEESMHLDHFWGRARDESVESCWALHLECDTQKTLNRPDWATWGQKFLEHARHHGYEAQVEKVNRRIHWNIARAP